MPTVSINGTGIYYRVRGRGTPILFIHPPLMSGEIFAAQTRELSRHFRTIAIDIRGHGRSSPSSAPVTYEQIAADLIALADRFHLPEAYLCGYSAGGGVALEAMLQCPGRFKGGILISAMPEVSDVRLRARLRMACLTAKSNLRLPLDMVISRGNADSGHTWRQLYAVARSCALIHAEQYFRASLKYRCTDRLHEIQCPQLLVYGGKDRPFQKYAGMLRERLPQVQYTCIDEGGHTLPFKFAKPLNARMLQWIHAMER